MLVVSLQQVAEEVVQAPRPDKRMSGSVEDLDTLFAGNNLELLEQQFSAFGFLAFDPRVDQAVTKYLAEGTLAADSGAQILIIFTTSKPAPTPSALNVEALDWIELDDGILPAQEMLRHLFVPGVPPPLPGLAFLRQFSVGDEAIYFPLAGRTTAEEIRQDIREICADVTKAAERASTGRQFIDRLAAKSQLRQRKFQRGGITSPREWLISAYRWVKANAGDLIAAVGLFA
ncbi:hypothetical protein [Kocuria arenosa]|uniref:hypothetical protein n=1 Tax=Kocuria arenosa TaxID=3071446 RepID=UPI0034D3E9CA